ncbi:MAG: twin-arginine translocase subunit TatC [Sedimentisphaerales bacterium]|nr:twin-arginine translocase subunit TatC [Sedimentisphaerales bacterium]
MGSTKKKIADPLDSTMSLGDHLEELRARLILAFFGLFIGMVVCLLMGKHIIRFIEGPYLKVVGSKSGGGGKTEQRDPNDMVTVFFANLASKLVTDSNAPAIDPNAVDYLRKVYVETLRSWPGGGVAVEVKDKSDNVVVGARLQTLAPADGFVSYMKISLIAGLILSSPWVFYQLWMFVAAGLFAHERRYVTTAIPFSVGLFVAGALFFLFIVAPLALKFLIGFNSKFLGVNSYFTFQNYISFVTLLMLVFGVAFQTPIAIFILTKSGLVSVDTLCRIRKYVILGVFVVAAVATPPDVISQITLAIPLYFLYELGILLSRFGGRKKEDSAVSPSETDVF